jgi:hypothetical protein
MRWAFNTAGNAYRGFVLHDDRTQVATLRVYFSTREFVDVVCDMPVPQLRTSGAHETGDCGFLFSPELMASIREKQTFAVFERTSGLLLYRQLASSRFLPTKTMVLLSPYSRPPPILETVRQSCRLSYPGVERHTRETTISILNISYADSIFVAGAVDWIRYEMFVGRGGFTSVVFLAEPEKLLARTIIGIRDGYRNGTIPRPSDDPQLLDIAMELSALDLDTPQGLAEWHVALSPIARMALSDPAVRLLTASPLGTALGSRDLAAAFSVLSRIDIVGTEATEELFVDLVKSVTDIESHYDLAAIPVRSPPEEPAVTALMGTEGARELTQLDRKLYEICNIGLTSETTNIDEAIEVLKSG